MSVKVLSTATFGLGVKPNLQSRLVQLSIASVVRTSCWSQARPFVNGRVLTRRSSYFGSSEFLVSYQNVSMKTDRGGSRIRRK
ncbi:hypothetical protein MPTK1_5g11070 [Marchantia polymorpha subsp. ruderalis]|uniref:Uncharacterized protein n=2 Tax=Marchantia polymorpha TaxID=3197 RepID=A0AAF6BH58_MARPO|nr:hypothetical protein MARPO_0093s0029 [Marchantia polymorpha]BBN11342.1 hypothetical protein Mp_5g11070 [Marchantia polymorpha subsp. ruderalis]|eukprot:PTQ32950.1 hypothetical protein MARPO_0093s0029 [Marchantia polymorpha]